jgi:sulfur carrier protein ThiS
MKTVKLVFRKEEHELKAGMTLQHTLEKIGLTSQAVLATRNGELLTDDEILHEGEVIKLIPVISGGSRS